MIKAVKNLFFMYFHIDEEPSVKSASLVVVWTLPHYKVLDILLKIKVLSNMQAYPEDGIK